MIDKPTNSQRDQIAPAADEPEVTVTTLPDFLECNFPPREYILCPFLQTQGSALVYAYRGVGKTHFSIGCGLAVATGASFLRFNAPKPRRVMFIDGEMPGVALQERLASAIKRLPENSTLPDPSYFQIITPDRMERPLPDLSTAEGQHAVEDWLQDVELLILDNISTLFRSGPRENDEESWRNSQEWILQLRRYGISTLLIHHANKNGSQRGTSKREDVLDTSILLKWPDDYRPQEGARFEVHYQKTRGIVGDAAEPFEAWLQDDIWTMKNIEDAQELQVAELKAMGLSVRSIAKETGLHESKVYRILKSKGLTGDGQK